MNEEEKERFAQSEDDVVNFIEKHISTLLNNLFNTRSVRLTITLFFRSIPSTTAYLLTPVFQRKYAGRRRTRQTLRILRGVQKNFNRSSGYRKFFHRQIFLLRRVLYHAHSDYSSSIFTKLYSFFTIFGCARLTFICIYGII